MTSLLPWRRGGAPPPGSGPAGVEGGRENHGLHSFVFYIELLAKPNKLDTLLHV